MSDERPLTHEDALLRCPDYRRYCADLDAERGPCALAFAAREDAR